MSSGTILVPKTLKTANNDANIDNHIKRNTVISTIVTTINVGMNREGATVNGSTEKYRKEQLFACQWGIIRYGRYNNLYGNFIFGFAYIYYIGDSTV